MVAAGPNRTTGQQGMILNYIISCCVRSTTCYALYNDKIVNLLVLLGYFKVSRIYCDRKNLDYKAPAGKYAVN